MLKIGRHFRFDDTTKFIVGRHKDENEMIKALALPGDVLFDAKDHVGPISLLRGDDSEKNMKLAAAIALRYSDAPRDQQGTVITEKNGIVTELVTGGITEPEYLQYRI